MQGLDPSRIALIITTQTEPEAIRWGTGYLVTSDLVLTAKHVVTTAGSISLRFLLHPENRVVRGASRDLAWHSETLDAVLLRLDRPIDVPGLPRWRNSRPEKDENWESTGFPVASTDVIDRFTEFTAAGLNGQLNYLGGSGTLQPNLELQVNNPPVSPGWKGISGAPVFVGEELVGIIKSYPDGFAGNRLSAVPSYMLLRDQGFVRAIAQPVLDYPGSTETAWVLLVLSEGQDADLEGKVQGVIMEYGERLALVAGKTVKDTLVKADILDAVDSPARWMELVKAACRADFMIVDVTDFQPAVMLILGIRSVVRRGITITSTARQWDDAERSRLPFNIQEARMIYHGLNAERHPIDQIGNAMLAGLKELRSNPAYLDLPAYDAVRCPRPAPEANEGILALCPFQPDYDRNWRRLSGDLRSYFSDAKRRVAERTVDSNSPRLVGQALYEQLRWAAMCAVDWSYWRPNVFFELGVRLACSDIGATSFIETSFASAAESDQQLQRRRLLELFRPFVYDLERFTDVFRRAKEAYDAIRHGDPVIVAQESLAHDASYRTCLEFFVWEGETILLQPQELLRRNIEAGFGADRQSSGTWQALFAANAGYAKKLEASFLEQWLAAWFYLQGRHPLDQLPGPVPGALRDLMISVGNQVVQAINSFGDSELKQLAREIYQVTRKLQSVADDAVKGS